MAQIKDWALSPEGYSEVQFSENSPFSAVSLAPAARLPRRLKSIAVFFYKLLHIQIVVGRSCYVGSAALGQQIPPQKRLQVAIEHLVHVAHFNLGAVVLGNAVGLQNVGPDLRAE